MASFINLKKLTAYTGILPYASEIFGIYQPLLGWKSKRIEKRQKPAANLGIDDKIAFIAANLEIPPAIRDDTVLTHISFRSQIAIAKPKSAKTPGSLLSILIRMRQEGASIEDLTTEVGLQRAIDEAQTAFNNNSNAFSEEFTKRSADERLQLNRRFEEEIQRIQDPDLVGLMRMELETQLAQVEQKVQKELIDKYINSQSILAGTLLQLNKNRQFQAIDKILTISTDDDNAFERLFEKPDNDAWLDNLNAADKREIDNVGLSPIGVVHLFRQYFFEFDTFLGSPVGHVWLSPGSTVELIETTTRRTLVEKTSETGFETTLKAEKTVTEQDEISDAVKEENQQNLKLGTTATVEQGWVTGSATGTTSIDYDDTQREAREKTHKYMRQQSEKVSSEIKKNYKSTFKIVTETTDMSSKRYVLNNTTDELINYEMRRKMRQVGVQVQDIGTYMCWQTFVDDPGSDLGLAELIHIAKPADVDPNKKYQPIDRLQPFSSSMNVNIPYKQISSSRGDLDESYEADGTEIDTDFNEGEEERIETHFVQKVVCERSNYELKGVTFDYQGNAVELKLDSINSADNTFAYSIQFINFRGNESIVVKANLKWEPLESANQQIDAENAKAETLENAAKLVEEKKAYYEAVRQRVTIASKLESRKFENLREEERIVVYRKLLDELLPNYYNTTDNHTRHKLSEIINAIFDIDKMLYFVAPEFWRPRMHQSHQQLGREGTVPSTNSAVGLNSSASIVATQAMYAPLLRQSMGIKFAESLKSGSKTNVPSDSIVRWGGQGREDNYYITDESKPAKMGTSLGWLLQLDGDERRNAFLNAPWVKAVIPVRPGKEIAAVNWLQHIEGNNIDFDIDILFALARRIEDKHKTASKPTETSPEESTNPINSDKIMATPVDKVYEFGFYPLQGGFKVNPDKDFELIDQWTEIVPTDQIVPVPVEYDSKTGRQK